MLGENPRFTCHIVTGGAWQTTYLVHSYPVGLDPVLVLGLVITQVTFKLCFKMHCIDVIFQVAAVS